MTNKDFFKYFLYSSINLYNQTKMLMPEGMSYRDPKIARTIEYLGISKNMRKIATSVLNLVVVMEIPISLLIICVYFFKCVFLKVFTPSCIITNETVMFARGAFVDENLLKKSHFDISRMVFVTTPIEVDNHLYKNYKKKPILSFVNYRELFTIFCMSNRMAFFIKKKYGHRDCLFRSYSSFNFFIVCFAFRNIDISNKIVFTAIDDRWAYLFGHLPHYKTFIQHGIFPPDIPFFPIGKIGTVDVGYYFNEQQRDLCNKHLFNKAPQCCRYMDNMNFSGNEKLINNGGLNILLVCHSAFYEKERKIIQDLSQNEHINLYIKPHPTDHSMRYVELHEKVPFKILEKTDYPHVDVVIAYESTLALEYSQVGVDVLMYNDNDFDRRYQRIKEYNLINND